MPRAPVPRESLPSGERLLRGGDGGVDVGLRPLRHAREHGGGGWVDAIERLPWARPDSVDEVSELLLAMRREPAASLRVRLGRRTILHTPKNLSDRCHGEERGDR